MKRVIPFFIFLFLVLPLISSASIEMKSGFKQGETLVAKISGNFFNTPGKEDVFFYQRHIRIPMEYDFVKIGNDFYLYAQLKEKQPDNYSLVIKDVSYYYKGDLKEEDIVKEFTITSETADFSISPGFVFADSDFSIEVQNLLDTSVTIHINSVFDSENSSVISAGQEKDLPFSVKGISLPLLTTIYLSSQNQVYATPVYISAKQEQEEEPELIGKSFMFSPPEINVHMATNSSARRIIYLENKGDTLHNITFSVSDSLKKYVSLSAQEIKELQKNKSFKLIIDISSPSVIASDAENITGYVNAEDSSGVKKSLLVYLKFTKASPDEENGNGKIPGSSQTCGQTGVVCLWDKEECDGTIEYLDVKCCIGTCILPSEEGKGNLKIFGWTIVIIVVGFLIWFFLSKYRGARRVVDLLKIAKGKKE